MTHLLGTLRLTGGFALALSLRSVNAQRGRAQLGGSKKQTILSLCRNMWGLYRCFSVVQSGGWRVRRVQRRRPVVMSSSVALFAGRDAIAKVNVSRGSDRQDPCRRHGSFPIRPWSISGPAPISVHRSRRHVSSQLLDAAGIVGELHAYSYSTTLLSSFLLSYSSSSLWILCISPWSPAPSCIRTPSSLPTGRSFDLGIPPSELTGSLFYDSLQTHWFLFI